MHDQLRASSSGTREEGSNSSNTHTSDVASRRDSDRPPVSKRMRTANACRSCRSRKTKCNGARPTCDVCETMGFECVYMGSAVQHGTSSQEKSRDQGLEERLAALETLVRSAVGAGTVNQGLGVPRPSSDDSFTAPTGSIEDAASAQHPHAIFGGHMQDNLAPLQDLDMGHVDEQGDVNGIDNTAERGCDDTVDGMGSVTFADESNSGDFGPTSNSALIGHITTFLSQAADPTHNRLAQPVDRLHVSNHAPPNISRPVSPRLRRNTTFPARGGMSKQGKHNSGYFDLPPEATVNRLVDRFFSEVGVMFPYIDKPTIVDELVRLRQIGFHNARRSWMCLLNTILAFSTYISSDRNQQEEDRRSSSHINLGRALRLLPNLAFQSPNLEILQALLVLTQFLQGTEHSSYAWSYQRLTIQAAIQIGAHKPTETSSRLTPVQQEMRTRCWHMCYILDKTTSITFGRPPSITRGQAVVPLPQQFEDSLPQAADDSGLLGYDPASISVEGYTQSIKLYQILGDIMQKAYRDNYDDIRNASYNDLLSAVVGTELELSDWKHQLPQPLHIVTREELVSSVETPPSLPFALSLVLTLRYLNARILLHRSIVETRLVQIPPLRELDDFGKQSIRISFDAASAMIDLISDITIHSIPSLTTNWFMLYYVFNSALVLLAVTIINAQQAVNEPSSYDHDNIAKLRVASQTLDRIGYPTRIVKRCRKYLDRLVEVASQSLSAQSSSFGSSVAGFGALNLQIPTPGRQEDGIAPFNIFDFNLSDYTFTDLPLADSMLPAHDFDQLWNPDLFSGGVL